jgi:uncharacterized protein with von Willebrand factor type A (vWA) domain
MFLDFFLLLRKVGIPTTLPEYLYLCEALAKGAGTGRVEDFYAVSRAALIKHERHLDTFDQCFAHYFKGMELISDALLTKDIPEEWLRKELERHLTPEEMAAIAAMGGPDALRKRFEELLQQQRERHQGGNKWIGTAGTSPFGAYGYNPEGYRIGQDQSRHRQAVKVWDERQFANLREDVELDTRGIKMALRHLREFTREGQAEELDITGTVRETSRQGGLLSLEMVPTRKNNVKVLMLMDVGGSMDDHILLSERLFSAARHQFKHLEFYYFHNCPYEFVWRDNRRRFRERISTWEVLHKYGRDYKLILVGDAAMSPYEILARGGSVEHHNAEAGSVWLSRLTNHYPNHIWLNPNPQGTWAYYQSTVLIQNLFPQRMFPLTVAGLKLGMKKLVRP